MHGMTQMEKHLKAQLPAVTTKMARANAPATETPKNEEHKAPLFSEEEPGMNEAIYFSINEVSEGTLQVPDYSQPHSGLCRHTIGYMNQFQIYSGVQGSFLKVL